MPGGGQAEVVHPRPSVRRRLLAFLLIPTLILMIMDTWFVYIVALRYSNYVHDRDLSESTLGLARALTIGRSNGDLSPEVQQILEFAPEGRSFFAVVSYRRGFVSGNRTLAKHALPRGRRTHSEPFDTVVNGMPVRAAVITVASPLDHADRLIVSIAETLHDRQQQAREILLLTIPVEMLLIAVLMALVWQGVRFGLRILDAPVRRLATRERNLAPISGPDIPVEILPLTRTIDGLFARVAELVELQERFVADAAHQLRTPLAGLSMHIERAMASVQDRDTEDALQHIRALTTRMTRSATQLLALARLQVPRRAVADLEPLDLKKWLPGVVAQRIPEALQAGVDLGYEEMCTTAMVAAEQGSLQELIDNLIDNSMLHAVNGGSITVSLCSKNDDATVRVAVDDDGPGVAEEFMQRLGERFFRPPGAVNGGSGLGLAIVSRIAEAHDAKLRFRRSAMGGLCVGIEFPVLAVGTPGPAR